MKIKDFFLWTDENRKKNFDRTFFMQTLMEAASHVDLSLRSRKRMNPTKIFYILEKKDVRHIKI